MKYRLRIVLIGVAVALIFNACKQRTSTDTDIITEFNYIDIAAESVKFANVPATINTLNTALLFSAYTLHTAQELNKEHTGTKKMKSFLKEIQMGMASEFSFQPGPINCAEGGERDNQIVSISPDSINMTVTLARCQFNGKIANGYVQIKKLIIEGVPLANEAWTIAVDLYFDLTLSDAKGIIAPVSLNGDAEFTMTAARQLYSMSISGKKLKVGIAGRSQTLKDYNLITANDSANGFYSITMDANYRSERFGEFHLMTDPYLVVNAGGDADRCQGTMTVTQLGRETNPSYLRIIANSDCIGMSLEFHKDADGVYDANTFASWEYLSSL